MDLYSGCLLNLDLQPHIPELINLESGLEMAGADFPSQRFALRGLSSDLRPLVYNSRSQIMNLILEAIVHT